MGKAKKGSKGTAAANAPNASILSKVVKSTTVVGANILKESADPKVLLTLTTLIGCVTLINKHPALSELRRKNIETLTYEYLKHFVKLENRESIKENNTFKTKN